MTIEEIRKEIEKIIEVISNKEIRTNKKRTNVDSKDNNLQNLEDKLKDSATKKLVRVLKGLTEDELVEYDERINQILNLLGYEEKSPDFEGINNPDIHALPGEEKIYWTELKKMLKKARNDSTTWRLEKMVDIIIKVKKHLGISDDELDQLTINTDLAMPTKQVGGINTSLTLKETIDKANHYQDLNVAANDIIREKGEIDQSKLDKLKNNQKPSDYDAIKNELSKIQNEIKKLLGISPTASLPSNWMSQLAKRSELDVARNDLNKWTAKFPNKTPEQVDKDIKDLQSRPATGTAVLTPIQQENLKYYYIMAAHFRKDKGNNWKQYIDKWKSEHESYVESSKQYFAQVEQQTGK